jgi:hypothetical protein
MREREREREIKSENMRENEEERDVSQRSAGQSLGEDRVQYSCGMVRCDTT